MIEIPFIMLMADDDKDDQLLAKDAIDENKLPIDLRFVNDGEELFQYLQGAGTFKGKNPWPSLIVLDLNMPRKDGRETLAELKSTPYLKRIPVVILTTSRNQEDMIMVYDLGAASYLRKPATYQALVRLMKTLGDYWVKTVELPLVSSELTAN